MVLDSPDVRLDRMNHNAIDFVYLLDQKIYDHRWVKVLEESEDIVFVASSAHPLAGQKALELKELLPEPFLDVYKRQELNSPSVYGCLVLSNTSASVPCSTTRPA